MTQDAIVDAIATRLATVEQQLLFLTAKHLIAAEKVIQAAREVCNANTVCHTQATGYMQRDMAIAVLDCALVIYDAREEKNYVS